MGKRLVHLADNDEWGRCLSILLKRKQRLCQQETCKNEQVVWLGGKTNDGDALVHLAAYASCETAMSLDSRRMALECLDLLLEVDPSSVHRIAGDGGSALHAAIAAASTSTILPASMDNNDVIDQESSHGSESDGSNSCDDDEWESDPDSGYDEKEYPSRTAVAEDSEYVNFSSDQISLKVIDLLLEHGADPIQPMRNDIDVSYIEEMEFVYSREAIVEQWTPFTLALIWVALASMKSELMNADAQSKTMILPLLTVKHMLLKGADPSCPMGANAPSNAAELIASCAHCLNAQICCDTLRMNGINVFSDEASFTVASCLQQILQMYTTISVPELSPEQAFAAALIANDTEASSAILSQSKCVIEEWRSLRLSDFLPMPQATWCLSGTRESWTLLTACVAVAATDSLNFLLSPHRSSSLSEDDATQAMEVAFWNGGMAKDIMSNLEQVDLDVDGDDRTRESQRKICAGLVNAVYPPPLSNPGSMEARQMFLDRLLLRASNDNWGNCHAIKILLSLGADPDANSVASLVQNNFRPLHFVAANRGGTGGISMAEALIHAGAHVELCDAQGRTPLNMALKNGNSRVVECIWQSQRNLSTGPLISGHDALSFGNAAIACQSLPMLKQAVATLRDSVDELGTDITEELLGRLLLSCVDERSGFSTRKGVDGMYPLVAAIFLILGINACSDAESSVSNAKGQELLPIFARDEISKYTVLHSTLRTDRNKELRLAILKPFCELAAKNDARGEERGEGAMPSLNFSCDHKFGSYTALHLACALGCEETIQTLLAYGADVTALDYQGRRPCQLIPKPENLSLSTRQQLGLDR